MSHTAGKPLPRMIWKPSTPPSSNQRRSCSAMSSGVPVNRACSKNASKPAAPARRASRRKVSTSKGEWARPVSVRQSWLLGR
ncbi:hypothetical protein UA75_05520 [Actinoalloteichus sp. GBA129-24]|nr:hypothetical protein UA75_05520 [Actinoalloteichus sp. GBA129-24]